MSKYYRVKLSVGKQEDGLWRVDALELPNCWVDAKTLEQGLSEIQEVIAMTLELYKREGWEIPQEITLGDELPTTAVIPVVLEEYSNTITMASKPIKTLRKA